MRMPFRAGGSCQAVAPLLTRYDDPTLDEAEQVLLSTHLLRCPDCLAHLQQYRGYERQLRQLPPIVLSTRVRTTIYDHLGAISGHGGNTRTLFPARPLWPGAAFLGMITAVVLLSALAAAQLAADYEGLPGTRSTTNAVLSRQFAGALLVANPTRVISGVGDTVNMNTLAVAVRPTATQPAALAATVRAIYPSDSRIVVALDGGTRNQRLVVTRDTRILHYDGHAIALANLPVGAAINVRYEQDANGSIIAQEIILQR